MPRPCIALSWHCRGRWVIQITASTHRECRAYLLLRWGWPAVSLAACICGFLFSYFWINLGPQQLKTPSEETGQKDQRAKKEKKRKQRTGSLEKGGKPVNMQTHSQAKQRVGGGPFLWPRVCALTARLCADSGPFVGQPQQVHSPAHSDLTSPCLRRYWHDVVVTQRVHICPGGSSCGDRRAVICRSGWCWLAACGGRKQAWTGLLR